MRMRSHLEYILNQVLAPESQDMIIQAMEAENMNLGQSAKIHIIIEGLLSQQIDLERDFLDYLTDEELFELGFQFGFEGHYERWQIIEDISSWFEDHFDLFINDEAIKIPDGNCTHTELIDWLGELTFNELQKICYIIEGQLGGSEYFHNLSENKSFDQVMHKMSLIHKDILHKAIMNYVQRSSLDEAEQQELKFEVKKANPELQMAYEILKVNKESSNTEIKKSYYQMARDYHPDTYAHQNLMGDDRELILDNFRNVKKAFEIIKNSRPGPW